MNDQFYCNLILKVRGALGTFVKVAQDVAAILDSDVTQMKEVKHGWEGPLEERLKTFDSLCAIFVRANLDPPPMEEALWRASLPKSHDEDHYTKAKASATKIRNRVYDSLKSQKCRVSKKARALVETLMLFPECEGYRGINKANILAMLNHLFVDELGLEPYRPDYSTMNVPEPLHITGPSRSVKLVVVDDSVKEIVSSALALVGIPNLQVDFFHYKGEFWNKLKSEELDDKLKETAKAVLEVKPDIVLMDQGLGNIEGHSLVAAIREEHFDGNEPIFVANTGGDASELLDVGCLANFDKGRRPKAILRAIDCF
jgi:CheY-like chemotaxis protein